MTELSDYDNMYFCDVFKEGQLTSNEVVLYEQTLQRYIQFLRTVHILPNHILNRSYTHILKEKPTFQLMASHCDFILNLVNDRMPAIKSHWGDDNSYLDEIDKMKHCRLFIKLVINHSPKWSPNGRDFIGAFIRGGQIVRPAPNSTMKKGANQPHYIIVIFLLYVD